jgi:dTDP-4-amino-4,6-dideoxygalactose transaminase
MTASAIGFFERDNVLNTVFSPWPSFSEEEADAVQNLLLTNKVNYWTGNQCREFEKEFAHWIGTEFAVALANGTVALDVALKALGIGPGDEVIVTSRSFIASVSCIVTAGATPVFADVAEDSQNITIATIVPCLTKRTKAIICVHLAGWPCDMDPIMELAQEQELFVIEDCAQAHGARYKGRSVGSIGHVGAWSFCQDKIMTTGGEGGMVTTNHYDLWSKMWSYKDHGKSWEQTIKKKPVGFTWLHETFGTNWRMLELQAVIGRIQLKKMAQWHALRLKNAQKIWRVAESLPALRVPQISPEIEHAAYKCYVFIKQDQLKVSREFLLNAINEQGVPCYSGACSEIYLEKAFDNTDWRPKERLPIAQKLGETSLMFLVHPTLTNEEIEKTCQVLVKTIRANSCL